MILVEDEGEDRYSSLQFTVSYMSSPDGRADQGITPYTLYGLPLQATHTAGRLGKPPGWLWKVAKWR